MRAKRRRRTAAAHAEPHASDLAAAAEAQARLMEDFATFLRERAERLRRGEREAAQGRAAE